MNWYLWLLEVWLLGVFIAVIRLVLQELSGPVPTQHPMRWLQTFLWPYILAKWLVSWPVRVRDQQRLEKEFNIFDPVGKGHRNFDLWIRANQRLVDSALQILAWELNDAFRVEEESKTSSATFQRLVEIRQTVNDRKRKFWKAWKLASKYGFSMKKTYSDYLK